MQRDTKKIKRKVFPETQYLTGSRALERSLAWLMVFCVTRNIWLSHLKKVLEKAPQRREY